MFSSLFMTAAHHRNVKSGILKILAWPLLCLFLVAGLWYWTITKINQERLAAEKKVLKDVSALCNDYVQYVTHSIEQANQINRQLQYGWEKSGGNLQLHDLAQGGVFRNTRIDNVLVINRLGEPAVSLNPIRPGISFADRDYFIYHKNDDSKALLIGRPLISRMSDKPVIPFTLRLNSDKKRFDGVALVAFEPQYLTSFYAGSFPGRTGLLMVAGLDGSLRSATIGDGTHEPRNAPLRSVPLFNSPEGSTYLKGDQWFSDTHSRYVAWKTLEEYPLVAMAGVSEQEFFAPYRRAWATDRAVAIAGSIILVLFAIAASVMTARIVRKKHQEEEVRKAYRMATEGANEGFYLFKPIYDKRGVSVDFIIIDCNERGAEFYGVTQVQLLQTKLSSLYPEHYFTELIDIFRGAMAVGFYEDESKTPLESSLKIEWAKRRLVRSGSGLAMTVQDVSERKLAEERLSYSVSLTNASLDSTAEGILIVDLEGNVVRWNQKFIDLFGLPQEFDASGSYGSLLELATSKMTHPDEFVAKVMDLYEHPEDSGQDLITLVDGRYFERYSQPLKIGDRTVGRYWSFRDVSEQKKNEIEQLKIEKLESLGILAGGIAHDFNNILTGIMGNISFARMFLSNPEKADQLLENAENASRRASSLATQLLTFARGGQPVKKRMALLPILEESLSLVLRGTKVKSVLSVPEDLHDIEADEGQLSQVFNNLIINAMQAMPGGGVLTVTAENQSLDDRNKLSLPEGEYIKIVFSDQGDGIPEENLKKIFDPYFTTKSGGSGLGLASAHSVIVRHGGLIAVESVIGSGTTFTIFLPSTGVCCAENQPVQATNQEERSSGESILVMDDEEIIQMLLKEMLKHLGYRVSTSKDGEEAVALYKTALESDSRYSAVIMDLTVPGGMGGKEAAEQILAIDPNACLIVSSGYSNDPIISEYAAYGFRAAVTKPYNVAQMSQLLSSVLCKDC